MNDPEILILLKLTLPVVLGSKLGSGDTITSPVCDPDKLREPYVPGATHIDVPAAAVDTALCMADVVLKQEVAALELNSM